jgi:hypothetical protein
MMPEKQSLDYGSYIIEIDSEREWLDDEQNPLNYNDCSKIICCAPVDMFGHEKMEEYEKDVVSLEKYLIDNDIIHIPVYYHGKDDVILSTEEYVNRLRGLKVGFAYVKTSHFVGHFFGFNSVTDFLKHQVEVYDYYLRGEVYYYKIINKETGEVVDSFGHFFGPDHEKSGLLNMALDFIEL